MNDCPPNCRICSARRSNPSWNAGPSTRMWRLRRDAAVQNLEEASKLEALIKKLIYATAYDVPVTGLDIAELLDMRTRLKDRRERSEKAIKFADEKAGRYA